jgi:hypothetical protein
MPDIASLRKRGAELKVPFFGDQISVTYNPIKVLDPEFSREWNQRQKTMLAEVGDWLQTWFDDLKQHPLRDDFPGRVHLTAAGIETIGDVPPSLEDLKKLRGIGDATARAIINAINTDLRIDTGELSRRREAVHTELAVMLIRDWDLIEDGVPMPVSVESLVSLPGLSEAISRAVWEDVKNLGNRNASTNSRSTLS